MRLKPSLAMHRNVLLKLMGQIIINLRSLVFIASFIMQCKTTSELVAIPPEHNEKQMVIRLMSKVFLKKILKFDLKIFLKKDF